MLTDVVYPGSQETSPRAGKCHREPGNVTRSRESSPGTGYFNRGHFVIKQQRASVPHGGSEGDVKAHECGLQDRQSHLDASNSKARGTGERGTLLSGLGSSTSPAASTNPGKKHFVPFLAVLLNEHLLQEVFWVARKIFLGINSLAMLPIAARLGDQLRIRLGDRNGVALGERRSARKLD